MKYDYRCSVNRTKAEELGINQHEVDELESNQHAVNLEPGHDTTLLDAAYKQSSGNTIEATSDNPAGSGIPVVFDRVLDTVTAGDWYEFATFYRENCHLRIV